MGLYPRLFYLKGLDVFLVKICIFVISMFIIIEIYCVRRVLKFFIYLSAVAIPQLFKVSENGLEEIQLNY